MSLVLIGERPGPATDPARPLYPHTTTGAAAKLARLLGWDRDTYLGNTHRYNAFHDGERLLGLDEARAHVTACLARHPGSNYVLVGAEAQRAAPARVRRIGFLEVREGALLLPHTSGVNRWYNSAENTAAASAALRAHAGPPAPVDALAAGSGAGNVLGAPAAGTASEDVLRALNARLPGSRLPAGPGRRPEELEWMLRVWSQATAYLSSPAQILAHAVPRTLARDEGLRAVPMLVHTLLTEPEHYQAWGIFGLLHKITGARPWPPKHAGRYALLRQDWLDWWRLNSTLAPGLFPG